MERVESASYVARHWRGDLSLAESFWLSGVLIGIPFKIVAKIASEIAALPPETTPLGWFLVAGSGLLMALIHWAWSEIGTWRACDKHRGWSIWPFLARLVTVLGVIMALGQYETIREKATAAKGDPLQAPPTVLYAAPAARDTSGNPFAEAAQRALHASDSYEVTPQAVHPNMPAAPSPSDDPIARARAIRAAGLGWESLVQPPVAPQPKR